MNREKINNAAEEAFEDYLLFSETTDSKSSDDYINGFKRGADWLMQQPLSERLTDEEKEKIRDIMKYPQRYIEPIEGTMTFQAIGIKNVLTAIFGADLFKGLYL